MTNDRERTGDWDRTEWEGDVPGREHPVDAPTDDITSTPKAGERWNKAEWVGDQGNGAMPLEDPDRMPEGESGLSGDRHAPSEQHWARGQSRDPS